MLEPDTYAGFAGRHEALATVDDEHQLSSCVCCCEPCLDYAEQTLHEAILLWHQAQRDQVGFPRFHEWFGIPLRAHNEWIEGRASALSLFSRRPDVPLPAPDE